MPVKSLGVSYVGGERSAAGGGGSTKDAGTFCPPSIEDAVAAGSWK
ncbi:hypothetical protein [Rhodococcus sp. 14-2470-1a]|nr:hypothetical protein [Rhodococcus sp. 14-2470-1a]